MESYLEKLEASANRNFHNFSGDEFMGYSPVSSNELDPNDRTLTITITNANVGAAKSARIFGASLDLTDANLDPDITISVSESSHVQVKTELLQDPFRIAGLKYNVTTIAQLSNTFSIGTSSSTGALSTKVWQPLNYRSAQNQIQTQIDAPAFMLLVDAKTFIDITLQPSEVVTLTLTLSERAELQNVLKGQNVATRTYRPVPTGLPQIDLAAKARG